MEKTNTNLTWARYALFSSLFLGLFMFSALSSRAAALSGTYTICGSGCDYASVNAAITDLSNNGVSGPVVFKIASGTFSESLYINSISGASAANTITFQGAGRGNTTITSSSNTVSLNSTSYVTFKDMTLESTGGNTVNANYAVSCSLLNCNVNNSSGNINIYDSYTAGWSVVNCHISGGYEAVYIYSDLNSSFGNNLYKNNKIVNFQFFGILSYYTTNATYTGNVIDSSAYGYGYGWESIYENGTEFSNNKVIAPGLYYPFILEYLNYYSSSRQAKIINNFFSNYQYYAYHYLSYCSNINISHNTYYGSSYGYMALYMYCDGSNSNLWFMSNIVMSSNTSYNYYGAAYILYFPTGNGSIMDGNDYVSNTGGYLINTENGAFSSLSSYQSYRSSYSYTSLYDASTQYFESHATNTKPTFVNAPSDLHLSASGNIPTGVYANVSTDIDGQSRNAAAPTAGADEQGSCTAPAFSACPSNVTASTASNSCDAAVSYTSTASGSPSYSYSFSGATTGSGSGTGSGATFSKGITNVTVTATNSCGNATCTFTVTVKDDIAPFVATKNISVDLVNGAATISPADVDNGSHDNCSLTLSLDKTSFTCANAGVNTVTLTATDASGNTSSANAQVTVNAAASASAAAGGKTTFCSGGSVTLTANAGSSYQWSNSSGPILGGSNQTYTAASSGTYYVTVTNQYGCSATSAGTAVTVNPNPTVSAGASPSTVYFGYTAAYNTSALSASSSISGSTYSWSSNPSGFSSTSSSPSVAPSSSATYTVTATTAAGCTGTASVKVTVEDVRCGNNNDKVLICHSCNSLCIAASAVAAHLANHSGDHLGNCGPCSAKPEAEDHMKVYPNPFSNSTNVELMLINDQNVDVNLWSIDGKMVSKIYSGEVTGGSVYNFTIDGAGLQPGIYFVKVQSGDYTQFTKIELIK